MTKAKIGGPVNLYRLRHSFVTLSLLAGADVKSVSRAAGHSSVWFTHDTYQHVLPAMRQDAAEKIGKLLRLSNSLEPRVEVFAKRELCLKRILDLTTNQGVA